MVLGYFLFGLFGDDLRFRLHWPLPAYAPALLALGLGVAVLSSALPYSLEMIALTRLSARHFSVLLSLEPAIAALAGAAFLGEQLGPRQWAAVVAIMVASTGTAYTARAPVAEPLAN